MEIDPSKVLYMTNRKDWRKWLESHFDKENEVWLVYPNKSSGKKRIPYNDVVEEALCFGWIDSIIKKLDEDNAVQRFTPRRQGSNYSQPNKERLRWLADRNLLHPTVKDQVKDILGEKFSFPSDIIREIQKDKKSWEHFNNFSESYRRIRISYIDQARIRPEIFQKRLDYFIKNTREGKQIKGFGGIEKYY
jgi:uncharacterized protein YdeI (YjbR/CyaY-like superfamily)